jgi:DNA-binding LacI/PurR family transcriptional regulator
VLKDVVGDFEDTVPSETEMEAAREALGEDGFVAYITCTRATEYHATQAREMQDFARNHGLNFRIYDSDADDYRQITLLERARSDGAAGLIVCPLNGELLRDRYWLQVELLAGALLAASA